MPRHIGSRNVAPTKDSRLVGANVSMRIFKLILAIMEHEGIHTITEVVERAIQLYADRVFGVGGPRNGTSSN